jgi:hypothetical protein
MSFKGGPGGDIGGNKVTTTNTGSFGTVVITETAYPLSAPADGAGGKLYVKADGKIYWVSNEVSETDLTAGGGGGSLTTEQVQDIVGAMFSGNTETGITVTYQDGDGTIDLATDVTANLTNEQVQDIVGAMFTGNTETGIAATYEDGDGTIDLVVSGGSTKATWQVLTPGRFKVTSNSKLFTHTDGIANAHGGDYTNQRTDIGSKTDTSFTLNSNLSLRYYTIGVSPYACTLKSIVMTNGIRDDGAYDYTSAPKFRIWKGTYTNDNTGDVTWTNVVDPIDMTGTQGKIYRSTTTSFGTGSFAAGDLIGLTFEGAHTNSNTNQFQCTITAIED